MRFGRSCIIAALWTASATVQPSSSISRFVRETNSTPAMIETPKREMNPTPAETLKLYPRMMSATMPPASASGIPAMATPTCRRFLYSAKRIRKIIPIVRGMTTARRDAARERFSNCPPQSME